jgi:hypothetical protein
MEDLETIRQAILVAALICLWCINKAAEATYRGPKMRPDRATVPNRGAARLENGWA